MPAKKIRYRVEGWVPKLEKKVENEYTWAKDEITALRNIVTRLKLPRWAVVYLEAYEAHPKKKTNQSPEGPKQHQLF